MPAKPARKGPWQIPALQTENARICMRAADMDARGASPGEIAKALGLESAHEAAKCVEKGWSIGPPAANWQTARRKSARILDMLFDRFWGLADDPGPATTVAGKPIAITDPETGEQSYLPDKQVQIAALNGIRAVNAEYRKLYGTDAPRQSVNVNATAPLEDIQAAVLQMRAEVQQAEAEAGADHDWDDGGGEDDGPPALPPGRM